MPRRGGGIAGLAAAGAQAFELIRQREDAGAVAEAMANLRLSTTQKFLDAQGKAADDAADFTPNVLSEFDRDVETMKSSAKNRRARQAIHDASLQLRDELGQRAAHWEAGRREAWRVSNLKKSIDTMSAGLALDPDQFGPAMVEQSALIEDMQFEPAQRQALREYLADSGFAAAASGVAKRNPVLALERLKDPKSDDPRFRSLNLEQRHRIEQLARGELVDQAANRIVDVYRDDGADAGTKALSALEQSSVPEDLRDTVRSSVFSQLSQLRAERRQASGDELERVERAIARGTAGPGVAQLVENLYRSNVYTVDERANTLAQIDASRIAAAKRNAGAAEISKALAAGLPLDPNDADHRKGLAAVFHNQVGDTPPGSEPWRAAAQMYATQYRMLPDQALAWTRQALRSPSPEIAATAAEFFGSVSAKAPDAVSGFDSDSKAFAGVVNSMIEAGTPRARAVETARANVFDVSDATRKNREHAWSGAGSNSLMGGQASALANLVDRDFDPSIWTGQPAAVDPRVTRIAGARQIGPDFDQLTQRYFLKTGDVDLARNLAWSDLRRVYSVSEVNGEPTLMAFAPERFGIKPEEVRAELEQLLIANPQADESTAEDIVIVPDARTLRLVGDALSGQPVSPSYALGRRDGELVTTPDGRVIRYTLPAGDELAKRIRAAQQQAEAEAEQQVREAKDRREEARRRSEFIMQRVK